MRLTLAQPTFLVLPLQFVTTLEANILSLLDVLTNVTIDTVTQGSVNVEDTISFTGSDSSAATSAQEALYTALTSGDTSIFGSSFGTVTVSSVASTNSSNPSKYSKLLLVHGSVP